MKWIFNILTSALAVMISAYFLPGVDVVNYGYAIIVAIVLSFLNTFLKPLMVLLTIPVTLITLGLFLVFINAVIIVLADYIVDGFAIDSFWHALLFSVTLSIITSFFEYINIKEEERKNQNKLND